MLPYIFLLTLVMLQLFISSNNRFNKPNKLSYYFSGIVLTIFATIRSSDVGTDSNNYVGIFNQFKDSTESLFSVKTSLALLYPVSTIFLTSKSTFLAVSSDMFCCLVTDLPKKTSSSFSP